ncbi:MAG: XRE family transcriptional regulator [Caulobacteraceae bacterium]|nr:XRE family transcriptional regulator [Caulobacteraceae bacterium]
MISSALRLVRIYHNLTPAEAAVKLGISRSYLSELEKGSKTASIEVLNKYAVAFDMPVSSLMLFVENADASPKGQGAQRFIAAKALKMLDWVATVASDQGSERLGSS